MISLLIRKVSFIRVNHEDFLSTRLFERSEVLYFESNGKRYEVCKAEPKVKVESNEAGAGGATTGMSAPAPREKLRFALVKEPFEKDLESNHKVPLDESDLEIISTNLEWRNFLWGDSCLNVEGKGLFPSLTCFKFFDRFDPNSQDTSML